MRESNTGSRIKPLSMPKLITHNQVLKNMLETYVFPKPRHMTAIKVEKPPWKTLEPIWLTAFFAL